MNVLRVFMVGFVSGSWPLRPEEDSPLGGLGGIGSPQVAVALGLPPKAITYRVNVIAVSM